MSDSQFMPSVGFSLLNGTADLTHPDIDILQHGSSQSKGLKVDRDKLRSYISIQINFRKKNTHDNTYYISLFKPCNLSDFYSRGYHMKYDEHNYDPLTLRWCPDMEQVNKYLSIKNGYSEIKERYSWSI